MELITRAELARRVGVTRQSIDKAIKKNRLRLVGEGRTAKIDFHDSLTEKYKNDNSSNRIVAKRDKCEAPESQEEIESQNPAPDLPGESVLLRDEKTKLQNKKLKMEMAEKMSDLIERERVEKVFNEFSSCIINYFFPLGDRLAPMLAGIFESTDQEKINEVKKMIDTEVEKAIKNVKKNISDSV